MTLHENSAFVWMARAFGLLTWFGTATLAAQTPSIDSLISVEKRIIASRKNIQSGHVVVSLQETVSRHIAGSRAINRYKLFFDHDKSRADVEIENPLSGAKQVSHWIITKDVFIRAEPSNEWVQLFGPKSRPQTTIEVPDPRRLGLVVWTFDTINQFGFESHLLRTDRQHLRIQSENVEGQAVWKVTFEHTTPAGQVSTEYWLALDAGNLPIFIGVTFGEGENRGIQSIRTKLANYGGIWFPKEVVYRDTEGGKVENEEIATVEEANFGEKLDENIFTIAGLGLAKGRVVSADGKLMIWTGEAMIPKIYGQEQVEQPYDGGLRWWLLVGNSVLLALIAAAILWRRWRRRAATRR